MRRILRAAVRMFLPAHTPMPKRCWRWLWLAAVFRLAIGIPFFLVFIIPYVLAIAFVTVCDWAGGRFGHVYVACHNRDLRNSGWKPPVRKAAVIGINPEWKKSA